MEEPPLDILLEEDVRKFLEDVKELCVKYGGKAVKRVDALSSGEVLGYLECTFPEGSSPFVEIDVYGYTTPEKEWALDICIGKSKNCPRVRSPKRVSIGAGFGVSQLRGLVNFEGYEKTESELNFRFGKEDRLKGFTIRTYRKKIAVDLIQ
jgi:hypothetical protein